MYEFTDKEIRAKFKRTKYGKKTNKMLYISLALMLLFLIPYILILILDLNLDENLLFTLTCVLNASIYIACYFDGKRDGAIEQFKKNK